MNTIATVLGIAMAIALAPWTFRTVGEIYVARRAGPASKKRVPSGRYTPPTKRRR